MMNISYRQYFILAYFRVPQILYLKISYPISSISFGVNRIISIIIFAYSAFCEIISILLSMVNSDLPFPYLFLGVSTPQWPLPIAIFIQQCIWHWIHHQASVIMTHFSPFNCCIQHHDDLWKKCINIKAAYYI